MEGERERGRGWREWDGGREGREWRMEGGRELDGGRGLMGKGMEGGIGKREGIGEGERREGWGDKRKRGEHCEGLAILHTEARLSILSGLLSSSSLSRYCSAPMESKRGDLKAISRTLLYQAEGNTPVQVPRDTKPSHGSPQVVPIGAHLW